MRSALVLLAWLALATLASSRLTGAPAATTAGWRATPEALRIACLGRERLLADALLTRGALTLVHGEPAERQRAARDLLLAARLDPQNSDLYRIGGLLLPVEPALELLRLGCDAFPDDGALPELAGFRVFLARGDQPGGREEAAVWYALSVDRANHRPYAPRFLERLVKGDEAGKTGGALIAEALVRLAEQEQARERPQPAVLDALRGLLGGALPTAR